MTDREALLTRLHKTLNQRAQVAQTVVNLETQLAPAKKHLASLDSSVNQLVQALYPSTLPALPQEQEGRAFRDENGELHMPTQDKPVAPETGGYAPATVTPPNPAVADPNMPEQASQLDLFDKYTLDQLKEMYNQKSKVLKDSKPWIKTVWDSAPSLLNMPPSSIESYPSPSVLDPAGDNVYTVKLEYEDGFVAIRTVNPSGVYYLSFYEKNEKGYLERIDAPPHNYNYLDENGQPLLQMGVKNTSGLAQAEAEKEAYYQKQMKMAMQSYVPTKTVPIKTYADYVGISDVVVDKAVAEAAMQAAKDWLAGGPMKEPKKPDASVAAAEGVGEQFPEGDGF